MSSIQYQDKKLSIFESALYRTTTTLISAPKFNLLVDPNWFPHEIESIREYLNSLGDKPLILLFTHSDYDHILAYKAFKADVVIASQKFADHPDKEKNLRLIREFDDKYYIRRDYPIEYPKIDYLVKEEGQELSLGNCRLVFYLAPGHTTDGIFTIVEPFGYFIAGDYLSNVEFPFIYDSSQAYLTTLRKVDLLLREHKIERMIPGHGDFARNTYEVQLRMQKSIEYIEALRESIWKEKPFDLKGWLARYEFPIGLTQAHADNEVLVRRELQRDKE